MTKHTYPRYTVWTDETLWGESARNSGLVYGVYDHVVNEKHRIEGVTITSYDQAKKEATKLNEQLEDPYTF